MASLDFNPRKPLFHADNPMGWEIHPRQIVSFSTKTGKLEYTTTKHMNVDGPAKSLPRKPNKLFALILIMLRAAPGWRPTRSQTHDPNTTAPSAVWQSTDVPVPNPSGGAVLECLEFTNTKSMRKETCAL